MATTNCDLLGYELWSPLSRDARTFPEYFFILTRLIIDLELIVEDELVESFEAPLR